MPSRHQLMKNMSKRSLFVIAGCLLLVLGWWSCHHRIDTAQSSPSTGGGRRGGAGGPGGPVPVVAGKVEQKDVPIFLDGLGTVQAFNTVTVRPRVDGELTQVLFREGEDVKTGDLLAVVDPRPYQAAMDQAVAKKAQDEAQLGNAQVVLKRNTELLARKVLDQQTFDTSKFTVDQFQATVQADQAAIDNAKTQLDYTQIKSPINGRTGIRLVDVGNVVHATDTSGIVVITKLQPISVVFTLPEQSLQAILNQGGAHGGLPVSALDRGNTTALDQGRVNFRQLPSPSICAAVVPLVTPFRQSKRRNAKLDYRIRLQLHSRGRRRNFVHHSRASRSSFSRQS